MRPYRITFAALSTFVLAKSTFAVNPALTPTATSVSDTLSNCQNTTSSDATASPGTNKKEERPSKIHKPFMHIAPGSTVIVPGQTQTLTGTFFSGSKKFDKVVLQSFDLAPKLITVAGGNECPGTVAGSTKMHCQWENVDAGGDILFHINMTLDSTAKASGGDLEVPFNMTFFIKHLSTGQLEVSDTIEKVMTWTTPYIQADASQFKQPRAITVSALPNAKYERLRLRHQFLWTDFHSTGFFLNGELPLHITVSGVNATGPKPSILVGTPDLVNPNKQETTMEAWLDSFGPFDNGNHTITHETGGILYISHTYKPDQENMPDPVTFTLAEGNAAQPFPYFREGITTNDEWRSMLEKTTVPFAEHSSQRVIVTGLAYAAQRYARDDQNEVLRIYDKIIDTQDKISGLNSASPDPRHRTSPLRPLVVLSKIDVLANSRHYRNAFGAKWGAEMWSQNQLMRAFTMWHELGHQRQHTFTWSWDILTEVTVDIYSLAVCRLPDVPRFWWERDHFLNPEEREKFFNLTVEQRDFDRRDLDRDVRISMFEQLRLAYGGDEFYHKLHTISRETPLTTITTNEDKKHFFMTQASSIFGKDLADYFIAWGLRPEQRTIDEMRSHPKPTEDYTKVPIKFQRNK